MTEITLLRTKDKFMCKCDMIDIYNCTNNRRI